VTVFTQRNFVADFLQAKCDFRRKSQVNRDGRISGSGIRIRPVFHLPVKSASGQIVCGKAGRIFTNYSTPFCTKSDVTAQLTAGISRENLPMKPVDWCSRPPAVCSGINCSPPIRFPARLLPAARRLYPRFIPLMQETLLPHAVLTLDSCQHHLYLNDATSKWLAPAFYWTAYQFTVVSIYWTLVLAHLPLQHICDHFVSSIVAYTRCSWWHKIAREIFGIISQSNGRMM